MIHLVVHRIASAFRKRTMAFWTKLSLSLSQLWHGNEDDGLELMMSPSYYEVLGIDVPQPDECHFIGNLGNKCSRRVFNGSRFCYWHHRDTSKYDPNAIRQYFGTDWSIIEAIEAEVQSGRSLEGAYLKGAGLGGNWFTRGANLAGADLRCSDLGGATLSYGSLRGASLRLADLEGAFLSDVDLRNRDFSGANLFLC